MASVWATVRKGLKAAAYVGATFGSSGIATGVSIGSAVLNSLATPNNRVRKTNNRVRKTNTAVRKKAARKTNRKTPEKKSGTK